MIEPLLVKGGVGVTVLHDLSSKVIPMREGIDCIFVFINVGVVMMLLVGDQIIELLEHGIRRL